MALGIMQAAGGIGLLVAAAVLYERRKWRVAGLAAAVIAQSLGLSLVPLGYAAIGLAARAVVVLRTDLQRDPRPVSHVEWALLAVYALSLL